MKRVFLFILLSFTLIWGAELKELSFDQAYGQASDKLIPDLPTLEGWFDSEHYLLSREDGLFKVNAKTGRESQLIDPEEKLAQLPKGLGLLDADERTPDLDKFIFLKDGDLYLYCRKAQTYTRITETKGEEKNPTFSPDGDKIAYTLDNNLFIYYIDNKKNVTLTRDGSKDILNGYSSWVYYEEIFGRGSRYRAFWWSPNSNSIAFMRYDQSKVPVFSIFRSEGTYGELEQQRYPKPGYPNPEVKIGVVNLSNHKTTWIDYKDPHDHYLAFPRWDKKGENIYFQWMNREQNQLKILAYNTQISATKEIYHEKQDAWVEFFENSDLFLLKNGGLLLRSSRDGWFHIYHVDQKCKVTKVTSGEWSVTAIEHVDWTRKAIYFSAHKEDSTETDYYKIRFKSDKTIRLTHSQGTHRVNVSPKGSYFIDRYSAVNVPTRLELRNKKGKLIRKIANSASPLLKEYNLAKVELFRIETGDGYKLPILWYLPPNLDKTKKYPVVFSIYGGPGSASVSNRFGRLSRYFLAQQGIIVLSVDHRGSGHFGKKGMSQMHRVLGKWEMHDYIETVKYLRKLPFVDTEKIGITGGSYGGYISALALTKGAGYFNFGIAGASVMDWKLYDSVYTERYMDTPAENPEGYHNASTLTYIDKYKDGTLRIDHGLMDDNVHMQNSVQFIDKVLDAEKTVEMMFYPGQRHGYRGGKRLDSNRADLDFWFRKFFGTQYK